MIKVRKYINTKMWYQQLLNYKKFISVTRTIDLYLERVIITQQILNVTCKWYEVKYNFGFFRNARYPSETTASFIHDGPSEKAILETLSYKYMACLILSHECYFSLSHLKENIE